MSSKNALRGACYLQKCDSLSVMKRKLKRFFLIAQLVCVLAFGLALASAQLKPAVTAGASGKISLEFQDTDIKTALRTLADMKGVNIVIDKEVAGTVTLSLHDITWDEAFASVLRVSGLYATSVGGLKSVRPLR